MSVVPADIASELQNVGMEDWNAFLAAMRILAFGRVDLGGDPANPTQGQSYAVIPGAIPFVAPASVSGTWKLRTFLRCENSGTTIKAKLRDLTAAADVASSETTDCSGTAADWSGTGQHQVSSSGLTLVAGHLYVAMAQASGITKQTWVDAVYLERTN